MQSLLTPPKEAPHKILALVGQAVPEKINFQLVNDSISCLYLPAFRSKASKLSEESNVYTFPHGKAYTYVTIF